eukprot:TRINITY_DN73_c0_g1_i2.p1 TRINITY_DN73_c0_g1~~TRINITY_DN73_c0_g1_i2.p1  ORF type:complete len:230 (+),score=116.57 TRINITY_DN73_c0_g1_i2:88-690(+)
MSLDDMMRLQLNLKMVSKQFKRDSAKSEKEEKKEKLQVKKAMEKGNMAGAQIYAQNAIRKKNEALNYLRLSSRMDAVASRVDTAVKMRSVTKSMGAVVKGMDKALAGMKIDQITEVMGAFEKQFEDLDVASEYMEQAIGGATATATPEDQVSALMKEVADEHGLDFKAELGGLQEAKLPEQKEAEQDDLAARLDKLKAQK